ncbi:MAG: GCN5-related N-acetyltransferase [Deinococcus sp.]|nr:GCN5-related N-acetyltransferase [Deinococcus sp.]
MIRPATSADSATVTALAVAAGMFPEEDTEMTDTMMADYFAGNRERGHSCVIDEEAGQPLGVAYWLPKPATDGTWELLMIAVHPDGQGQGRGGALMRHVEDALRIQGQRILLVETSGTADFELTRRFYVKCGYEQEARVRDYYGAGTDMVLFRKVLTGS